jgi:hypothetical protein
MNLTQIKSLFFKVLIGCLVAAAALAVVTVLIGSFSDILGKALFTILLVALHALFGISFITTHEKQDSENDLSFFTNATFSIIVVSFMTSILGVWGVLPGSFVFRLYCLYFVLLFAILHGEVLAKITGKQRNINNVVFANFIFMVTVVGLLVPVIFLDSSGFGDFYYRLLSACGIVDATLTLVAVILHHLYVQKHPKTPDPIFTIQQLPQLPGQPAQSVQVAVPQPAKRHMNPLVLVLIVYVVLQILGSVILFGFSALRH